MRALDNQTPDCRLHEVLEFKAEVGDLTVVTGRWRTCCPHSPLRKHGDGGTIDHSLAAKGLHGTTQMWLRAGLSWELMAAP